MSDLRIDYGPLSGILDDAKKASGKKRAPRSWKSFFLRALRGLGLLAALAILPFVLLIRGGVFVYREWAFGTWPSLFLAALATTLLLAGYAWFVSRRLGAGVGKQKLFMRASAGFGVAYVLYALVFVASANVKADEVQAEYRTLHPLLRVASSALILVDRGAVITDAGRTVEDYAIMGLPANEASLHFEQENGYVHALDLRTVGRPEWRNRAVELGFWAMGFHSLRHVGTADHLHISLRLPE